MKRRLGWALAAATALTVASLSASLGAFAQGAPLPQSPVAAPPGAPIGTPSGPLPPAATPSPDLTTLAEGEPLRFNAAIIRGLDKVTGKAKDYTAVVNRPLKIGTLEITVRACLKAPDTVTPETWVFIDVTDHPMRTVDGVQPDPVILPSRWIFASSPAMNALEHPVYDVWAINCKT